MLKATLWFAASVFDVLTAAGFVAKTLCEGNQIDCPLTQKSSHLVFQCDAIPSSASVYTGFH